MGCHRPFQGGQLNGKSFAGSTQAQRVVRQPFFNGAPTQVHFIQNSTMVGTWVDEQGAANLSVGLDRIQFMSSDQLAF